MAMGHSIGMVVDRIREGQSEFHRVLLSFLARISGFCGKFCMTDWNFLKIRPNTFIALKKMVGNSIVRNLNILNFPVHCFLTTGSQGLLMENIVLDNRAGDKPNSESGKKSAGHNTDGFGFQSSDNIVLRNSKVWNQDDCVAITSGTNITVHGMYCHGGHGLSIGSVGGKNSKWKTKQ
jgi:polygalacturonase